jgi:hypothetical protein
VPNTDPHATYSRLLTRSWKLAESLDDLADEGGLRRLAATMRPASVERIAALLRDLEHEIHHQLEDLGQPVRPARKLLLRRQANRPDPIPTAT